jgi:hypothetical protein
MNNIKLLKKYGYIIILCCLLVLTSTANASCTTTSSTGSLNNIDAKTLPVAFDGTYAGGQFVIIPSSIELATKMPESPDKILVYKLNTMNDACIRNIANKLGFPNSSLIKIEANQDSENLQIYNAVNGDAVLEVSANGYFAARYGDSPSLDSGGITLSEKECITKAQEWLKSHGLYPEEVSKIATGPILQVSTYNIETGFHSENTILTYGISFFTNIGEYQSSLPEAYVEIDTNGEIIEVDLHVQQLKELGYVDIKTAEEAFNKLENVFNNKVANSPEISGCMINFTDFSRLTITKVSIQYSKNGNYIQPIYFFQGTAYFDDGLGTTEEFRGRVDAVIR